VDEDVRVVYERHEEVGDGGDGGKHALGLLEKLAEVVDVKVNRSDLSRHLYDVPRITYNLIQEFDQVARELLELRLRSLVLEVLDVPQADLEQRLRLERKQPELIVIRSALLEQLDQHFQALILVVKLHALKLGLHFLPFQVKLNHVFLDAGYRLALQHLEDLLNLIRPQAFIQPIATAIHISRMHSK